MNSRLTSLLFSIGKYGIFRSLLWLWRITLVKLNIVDFIKVSKGRKVFLRNRTSDLPVFRQVFMNGEYDFHIPIAEPKVIVDVGSNIGLFTIFMMRKYPVATYICLEPQPQNYDQLMKNVTEEKNVFLLRKALWKDNNGVLIGVDPKFGEWGASISGSDNRQKVETITMNEIFRRFNLDKIDILKIDIEGSERFVFEHDVDWLRKVKVLIIELHDFLDENSSGNFFKAIGEIGDFSSSIQGENLVFINSGL